MVGAASEPSTSIVTPNPMLVTGPTIVVASSAVGDGGSCSRFETPPKRNRRISETGTPNERATSECASSCASTEPKKSSAATTASTKLSSIGQPGCHVAKTIVRFQLTSRKMTIQLRSSVTWMPNNFPSLIPPRMRCVRCTVRAHPGASSARRSGRCFHDQAKEHVMNKPRIVPLIAGGTLALASFAGCEATVSTQPIGQTTVTATYFVPNDQAIKDVTTTRCDRELSCNNIGVGHSWIRTTRASARFIRTRACRSVRRDVRTVSTAITSPRACRTSATSAAATRSIR